MRLINNVRLITRVYGIYTFSLGSNYMYNHLKLHCIHVNIKVIKEPEYEALDSTIFLE